MLHAAQPPKPTAMTTRLPLTLSLSHQPSIARSSRSRRSSTATDEDVFGDDNALDSPITIDDAPLGDFPPPRHQYPDQQFSNFNRSTASLSHSINTPPPPPPPTTQIDRSSTAKRRLMIDDNPNPPGGGLSRSQSTSSRITIPRSQSPYNGPTAPSHPYHMYPQVTRASSVASSSTLRPGAETPFVPQGGPQHPYGLYQQSTVAEEGEDITASGFPLGFPRSGFQPSSGGSSSDVGDIIGSDGHIEHLPPYTRFADNTVAKGNMDHILSRRASRLSQVTTTQRSVTDTHSHAPENPEAASTASLLPATEQFEEETPAQRAMKEGWRETWKDKLRKPTRIAGMPLWGVICVIVIVVLSAIGGGLVGGIIGNRQGQQQAYANGAVTTIWLDAVPTTLDPNTPALPTGHYQIPLNQSQEIKQCIPNSNAAYLPAWGCMDIAYIGLNIFKDPEANNMMAVFEDFSVNTQDFRYGPQPPDFNGSAFALQPMEDKDAGELGVAMFFTVLFDKLSILPEEAIPLHPDKRVIGHDVIERSVAAYDGQPLKPYQRPWFCFWNSTINEFFIYLNEDAPKGLSSPQTYKTSTTTTTSPAVTPFSLSSSSSTSGVLMQELTVPATSSTQPPTTFLAYNPTYPGASPPPAATTPASKQKRSYETSAVDVSNYPKLVKMVEKRKPSDPTVSDHVEPYCQKMEILPNWSIVPIDAPTICIEEIQYPKATSSTAKRLLPRYQRDVVSDLESYCICEWQSC